MAERTFCGVVGAGALAGIVKRVTWNELGRVRRLSLRPVEVWAGMSVVRDGLT